ncbi:MAG: HdeD family acid-resistance protein [Pseudomonadota bacterium]|nr:MAG: HdeD family acid-resistance protein [Pseudomonadota bacterium]
MNDTEMMKAANEVLGEVTKNWGWMLALGIIMVILGTVGLGMTFTLTMVSVLYFGVLLLIGGGVQIFDAFKCKGWKSILWHVLIGLIYVAAGIVIFNDPALASATLTLVIAGALVGIGIVRIIIAFQMRGVPGWIWTLIGGIAAIALGAMIFAKWPVSGLWVIGLFVAIELIFNGWSHIMIALAAKAASRALKEAGGEAAAAT